MFPLYVAASGGAVDAPAGYEQQVRKPVQIAPCRLADRLGAAQGHEGALGAPAHRAREVGRSGGAAAAGQDELLERRELAIPFLDRVFQAFYLLVLQKRVPGNGELAAEVEQVVLHLLEHGPHLRGNFFRKNQSDTAVQLVDVAEGGDARAVLRHPGAVAKPGFARVPGARGDLREAVAHQEFLFTSLSTSPFASRVRSRSPALASRASRSTVPSAPYVML